MVKRERRVSCSRIVRSVSGESSPVNTMPGVHPRQALMWRSWLLSGAATAALAGRAVTTDRTFGTRAVGHRYVRGDRAIGPVVTDCCSPGTAVVAGDGGITRTAEVAGDGGMVRTGCHMAVGAGGDGTTVGVKSVDGESSPVNMMPGVHLCQALMWRSWLLPAQSVWGAIDRPAVLACTVSCSAS